MSQSSERPIVSDPLAGAGCATNTCSPNTRTNAPGRGLLGAVLAMRESISLNVALSERADHRDPRGRHDDVTRRGRTAIAAEVEPRGHARAADATCEQTLGDVVPRVRRRVEGVAAGLIHHLGLGVV